MSTIAVAAPRSRRTRTEAAAEPLSTTVVTVLGAFVTISVIAVWLVLYALVFSGLEATRENSVLYATLRANLSAATTPIGGVIAPGTPIALLQAPAAGLSDEVIVEGTAPGDLRAGPGHLRSSPLPGQAGVSVIYGRSVTFGKPFAHLTSFAPGDELTVTTGQGKFTYRVDGVRRTGDPVPAPPAPGRGRIVLETSTGSGFGAAQTVFVDATMSGDTQAAPPGRLATVPALERAMGTDPSVLLRLVFWLQALLLVEVAVVWGWRRWGGRQAWLVGTPAVIGVLWGASSTALMLMPNLV